MKPSLPYLLPLVLAVALMPAKTLAQQVNDKQADEALRQKAYKLLESLAEQIGSLQSGENRARMGSNIARSLWAHNEARAREMFLTVTKEIKAGLDDKDPNRYHLKAKFIKLREDTALRIGQFDPEWALEFLNETKPIDVKSSDDQLTLDLARFFVENNPDIAVKLGRESLRHGVSPALWRLMFSLNKNSRSHASALLVEIVKAAPFQNIRYVMEHEQFYFTLARLVEPNLGRDPAFHELMNYFTDVALKAGCGKKKQDNDTYHFCHRLGLVVPLMEKVAAKRVAPLKYLARRDNFPYEWSPEISEYDDVYRNGSVDDLLAVISKGKRFRNYGQSLVIRKLIEAGNIERARKLANEFAWGEPSIKESVVKEVNNAERIVNEDTSEELLRQAKEFLSEEAEFYYLFRSATEIGARNRQTTVKLLDRASELLDKVPPERWQMQYRIGIAMRYCHVKSDRCFAIIKPVVRSMNELVSAAAKLNGFDNGYFYDGEWNMTAEGGVGSLLTMLAQNAVYFALYDFDRSVDLTSLFERREIRLMAQLKLAQGVLDGPPKRPFYVDEY